MKQAVVCCTSLNFSSYYTLLGVCRLPEQSCQADDVEAPASSRQEHSWVSPRAVGNDYNWATCLHRSRLGWVLVNRRHSSAVGSSREASCLESCCSLQNNCLASAEDLQWEPNGFFSLRLNTGLTRWHTFTCIQNRGVLQLFSSLAPFLSMHFPFQLLTPCLTIILQEGQATLPSRRLRSGHLKSTP